MAKAKGKEKPSASNVPAEAEVTDANAEPTSEPIRMEEDAETTVDTGFDEPKEVEELEEAEEEEAGEEEAEEEGAEGVKEDGTADAATPTVIAEGEKTEEGDKKEEVKGDEKVEGASKKKARRIRKKKKKAGGATAAASNDADKPEASAEKGTKKIDGMGLIFMCNAKTKKDCYQYKVFGLPESKKELVSKVYKGMRLFLFDIDLKLMYGIYKAASPGGYNLEPKAFKSAFPSQVRFTVLNDCKPLPEEKFKAAFKSNYYGKNKFNPELSPEQVKNLCKLFMSEGKVGSKQNRREGQSNAPASIGRDRKRGPRPRDIARRPAERTYTRRGPPPMYAREAAYLSPPPRAMMLAPPPLPPPSYGYDRPVDDYYYRREPPRDPRIYRDVEMRPVEYHDPYSMYGEPAPYREAGYPAGGSVPSAYGHPPPPMYRY